MERRKLSVEGMACDGCERAVEAAIGRIDGVTRVEADSEADAVTLVAEPDVGDDEIGEAVEGAGFDLAA